MRDISLESLNLEDEGDIVFLYETRSHPEICKYLLGKPPQDLESHKSWLCKNVPVKRLMYILRCDGDRAGYCHAYDFDNNDSVEVGFVIHPDYQGKGLGHAMIKIFIEKIIKIMPSRKVQLYVQADNEKAVSLYLKHGFVMVSCVENVIEMEKRNGCGTQFQEGSLRL